MHRSLIAAALLLVPLVAAGQARPLETTEEALKRRDAERLEQFRSSPQRSEPLGGYRTSDEIAPRGTQSSPTFRPAPREEDRGVDHGERFRRDPTYIQPVTPPRR